MVSEGRSGPSCLNSCYRRRGKGCVPAVEVLITPAVREALKNPARHMEVRKLMSDGKKQLGTQTPEQHVAELIEDG